MNRKLYVARSSRIAARMLGEEMLVMSSRGSTLFTLNPTATILWQAADGARPLDEIVESRICSRFKVEPEEAMRDAEALASDLANHGILLISEQPISPRPICWRRATSRRKRSRGSRPAWCRFKPSRLFQMRGCTILRPHSCPGFRLTLAVRFCFACSGTLKLQDTYILSFVNRLTRYPWIHTRDGIAPWWCFASA
jgi:hypothetical protein